MPNELEFHQYADIFALLEGDELDALVSSIRNCGVREPIVLYESKILDGRNRYRAARNANISVHEIPMREFDTEKDGDPTDFVWDENVNRRHLNETQRGFAAAEMETFRHGGNRISQELHGDLEHKPATRKELGRHYGVGHGTMHRMSVVRHNGVPELKAVARAGKVSVRTAKAIAEVPAEAQKAILEGTKAASDRAKALQVEAAKVVQRAKIAEVAKCNRVLDPAGKSFDLVYADPPWRFDEELTGSSRAVENHYATMELKDICALPVDKLAAKTAILFLWTTDHHFRDGSADAVIKAWGFEGSRAGMVWVKDKIGLGRFVRNRHEHLVIATRGDFPAPPTDCVPDSVIIAPRGTHSEKPPLHEMIERMTPGLNRRIELFARRRVPGWNAWGNQVDQGTDAEGTRVVMPMRPPVESEITLPSSAVPELQAPGSAPSTGSPQNT
jgi:N6-adenosine-specific RNA methylase IME4